MIPDHILKVGIVLPEDKQSSIQVFFPEPDLYFIEGHTDIPLLSKMNIMVKGDQLLIGSTSYHKLVLKRRSTKNDDYETCVQLSPVTAGRGFHWQQNISGQYLGDVEFQVKDGLLLCINHIPIEQYLICVSTSEMSANCPSAFLEVQTIIARSWVLSATEQKHKDLGLDVCNDDCCQRYQGIDQISPSLEKVIKKTSGVVLTYQDEICDTRYSKCCGGKTESFDNVWQGKSHPYLKSQLDTPINSNEAFHSLTQEGFADKWIRSSPDAYCSPSFISEKDIKIYTGKVDKPDAYFRWNISYSQDVLSNLLSSKIGLPIKDILDIILLQRGDSSRLTLIEIIYQNKNDEIERIMIESEYEIRRILHPKFLYSSAFIIQKRNIVNEVPMQFDLIGAGWGHGVGLCQIGALGMALNGHSVDSIFTHYYPGTRLKKLY